MEVKNIFVRSRVIFLASAHRFKPFLDEEDASHFNSESPPVGRTRPVASFRESKSTSRTRRAGSANSIRSGSDYGSCEQVNKNFSIFNWQLWKIHLAS